MIATPRLKDALAILGAAYLVLLQTNLALVVRSSLVPPLPLAIASCAFEGGAEAWRAVTSASALSWACVGFLAWVRPRMTRIGWVERRCRTEAARHRRLP